MAELPADCHFALEAAEENRVAFELRMGNLDGNQLARFQVRGLINCGHPCADHEGFNAETLELFARLELSH